jgi:hypothetical protein
VALALFQPVSVTVPGTGSQGAPQVTGVAGHFYEGASNFFALGVADSAGAFPVGDASNAA